MDIYATFKQIYLILGFPGGAMVKNPSAHAGDARDLSSVPGLRRPPGGGNDILSSILAWEMSRSEEPGWLQSMQSQKSEIRLSD